MDMADWALRAFDPSAYRSSVSLMNNKSREVEPAWHSTRSVPARSGGALGRDPPRRWGRSLIPGRCMRLAWTDFVPAGFLIAAVSCGDAVGLREQSAEVDFESERTYEFQLFNLDLDSYVILRAHSSLTVAQRSS